MAGRLTLLALGGISMAALAIAVCFFRFWSASRDRFFLYFGLAFLLQAVDRIGLGLLDHPNEGNPWIYGVRLVAYSLILVAIWEKNRGAAR